MRAERVTSVKPMLHALSPIEAAIIHEPDLATRAWWQPTSSRAEAETYLNDLALKLRHCPLSLNDLDNWARTPALDRVSLALVRHSSTSGALALSWHRGAADAHISHALVQLIFGNDGHLEGYSAAIYDDVQVYTRTLAQLVARVLPSTPLAVDVSLLVAAPTPPVSIDVHRWSTVGDVICAVGAQLAPHLSAAKRAAHHLALLQLLRDRRVLRAAIDALALDWRGVTALAGVFGRHGLAGELLDVALAADAPEGPWVTGGAARPGGSVAATVLTCLVQAHCQKWLAPLLNSELEDWLHHGEHNENEVLALISKATLDVTSSPTASCPELLRVIVSKLVAMRPQAGDERAFIAGVVLAPFVRAFASNAVEAAAVGQGGAARKLLDATPMIAQLGENAAPRSVSLSTWRIFAPPLDAALRQFCAALADTAPKRMRADTTAEDVFGDRIQCPVPGTDAPLDTESLELLQRTLAPRSATLLTALRAACPGESLDDAIRDAVTLALPSGAAVTWSAVESLIREPPSLVGQCALRVMSDAPMVAWNDALLAGVLRHADNALQSAAIRLLNASEVRNDVSRETRLRESRAFPPSSELSLAQLQIVPRATAEPSTRKLLQTMLQCNDPKYDRSVALLAALDDASDIDVARFRQATARQAAQRPSAPAHAPPGVSMRHSKSLQSRLRRDVTVSLWFGSRCETVRVAPGDTAEMAVLRVSDRELSDVVSDATWALKLAFRDQFIVGDDRRRVPLCDFAWVRELVLDGRPIAFVVLSTLDARCIDGSVASHEHTAAFVRDVVEHAAPARAADAQSARDVGSRQKFECTVNEVVFCSADSADAETPATPTSPGRRWPALAVEASLSFGAHVVGAARRTAPGNVQAVVVDAGGDSGSKTKRRGRSHTDKAAPAVDGWVPPVDGNVVGVLGIEEALVVSAHLRHLPLGTTVQWRLLSGSTVVAETTTQLFDADGELMQGRRVFELCARDEGGAARTAALRESRAFLCVTLFMFLGDPKAPRTHVVHPDVLLGGELAELAVGKRGAPSDDERRALAAVDLADSLRVTSEAEMRLFRKYRSSLAQLAPRCLTRICDGAVDWVSPSDVDEFHALVHQWPPVEPYVAVGQLAAGVVDRAVREHAVRSLRAAALSDDALVRLVPQLIEGLRAEPFDDGALARFLLGRAAESPLVVGCALAMAMRVELCYALVRPVEPLRKLSASVPRLQLRFALLLERLLGVCGRATSDTLAAQMEAIAQLESLNRIVKPLPYGAKRSEALDRALSDGLPNWPREWRSPLDPSLVCSRPSVSRSRALDSHQCPMLISMRLVETVPSGGPAGDVDDDSAAIIFKIGDDLRQDAVLLQLLNIFQDAWASSGVDAELVLYRAVSVGYECGMVECVRHCATIAKIQATRGGGMLGALKSTPLKLFLEERTPADATDADKLLWSDVEDNFVRSLAAACVATFILGVADRHNDNIMVKRDGRLFHIDFGHILGRFQTFGGVIKRERAPFSLTPEMAHVVGGGDSEAFERFVVVCERAFNCARRLGPALVGLLASLLGTGLREVREEDAVLFVRASCGDAAASDEEAAQAFRGLIFESLGTLTTRLLNLSHLLAHKKSVKEAQ